MTSPIIYWFRQDLRLHDLPGLAAAAATGRPLLACYILDDHTPGEAAPGSASRWWLHHSLEALAGQLANLGLPLVLRRGDTVAELAGLAKETGADTVHCSRQYEPWARDLESGAHLALKQAGVALRRYSGALLFEPEQVLNKSGQPFRVFTPFWRYCLSIDAPPLPRPPAEPLTAHRSTVASERLEDWRLCPKKPDWAANWKNHWQPGTPGARERLRTFLTGGIGDYSEGRNHPARDCTSRLSPHLHFGELSPREVWHEAQQLAVATPALQAQVDKFLSELGWREFSYHLLYHFPSMPEQAFKAPFRDFPWLGNEQGLAAWQRGQTGYPVVDAGMRELWQTGYMHNRIRMVVASFLTKHLLVHWRAGARWFWDTLVDADLANNSCGWQWVAGSGADAAPYFRIFNPVLQGEKFDGNGDYIRRWVPELAGLPDRYLNRPWEAPAEVLSAAGVVPGDTYPHPIVDHQQAREAALAAYSSIKR